MKILKNNLTCRFIVLAIFALVLYFFNQAKHPEQIVLEVNVKPDTSESILVQEALKNPENLVAKILEDETSNKASTEVNHKPASEFTDDLPNKVKQEFSDKPADTASTLDPTIKASLKNSEPYADEAYVNPDSTLNQSIVNALHEMRDKRLTREE